MKITYRLQRPEYLDHATFAVQAYLRHLVNTDDEKAGHSVSFPDGVRATVYYTKQGNLAVRASYSDARFKAENGSRERSDQIDMESVWLAGSVSILQTKAVE